MLCPQELTKSCHVIVHGDSSGVGGSSCCGHGGHSSRLPPCRGGGSGSCGMSCPVCLCLAPEGSWYPLTSPGKFCWGVKGFRLQGPGRGDRGHGHKDHLPWPPELPALPWPPEPLATPWPPELPAPPWPPLSVCSTLEVPVLCSCLCLSWGASRAPTPPPRWNCYGMGHAFREGGVMSGFCCVCHVFPPHVSIFGLFPVLV